VVPSLIGQTGFPIHTTLDTKIVSGQSHPWKHTISHLTVINFNGSIDTKLIFYDIHCLIRHIFNSYPTGARDFADIHT